MDLHNSTATVREALELFALLQSSSFYSKPEKLAYLDNIPDLVDLCKVEHYGLGIGLAKRVATVVELVTRFKILLPD